MHTKLVHFVFAWMFERKYENSGDLNAASRLAPVLIQSGDECEAESTKYISALRTCVFIMAKSCK